jgi:hypothetical protein
LQLSKTNRDEIIKNILLEKDHRYIIQQLIDRLFLERTIDLFGQVVKAKLNDGVIDNNWYKNNMLSNKLKKEDIAWNAGLNLKSINNIHKSVTKDIVIKEAGKHYDALLENIKDLLIDDDVDIKLTITMKNVSITLTVNESLIVINAIAVMRSGLRGGVWSTMGKQIEQPLLVTLSKLLNVKSKYYQNTCSNVSSNNVREADFFLLNSKNECLRCEVKLMGKGNPEGVDGAIARSAKLFIADKLSEQNKGELKKYNILWVALSEGDTLRQFSRCLDKLSIPHDKPIEKIKVNHITKILKNLN